MSNVYVCGAHAPYGLTRAKAIRHMVELLGSTDVVEDIVKRHDASPEIPEGSCYRRESLSSRVLLPIFQQLGGSAEELMKEYRNDHSKRSTKPRRAGRRRSREAPTLLKGLGIDADLVLSRILSAAKNHELTASQFRRQVLELEPVLLLDTSK